MPEEHPGGDGGSRPGSGTGLGAMFVANPKSMDTEPTPGPSRVSPLEPAGDAARPGGPAADGTRGESVKPAAGAAAGVEKAAAPGADAAGEQWVMSLGDVFRMGLGAWLVGMAALIVASVRVLSVEFLGALVAGVALGVACSASYRLNMRRKRERSVRYRMVPGVKGVQELLHTLPSWIRFRDTEKVEWLNDVLRKTWPFYDTAICAVVKQQVEPLLDEYKPPFIKKIYFSKLTFGSNPFRVEGVRVNESRTDRVVVEADFRWAGDANIVLGIEVPVGGKFARMAPKVSNLAVRCGGERGERGEGEKEKKGAV